MKNEIIKGKINVVDKSDQAINFQGTHKYIPSTEEYAGANLRDQGNIHVNVDGGGWLGVKLSGDSQFDDMFFAQGVHPFVVKAIKAPSGAGTPVLVANDVLIIV